MAASSDPRARIEDDKAGIATIAMTATAESTSGGMLQGAIDATHGFERGSEGQRERAAQCRAACDGPTPRG